MHHDFRYTQLVNLMRSASLCLYEVIETNYRACGSSCCDQLIPLMKCFSSGCSCRSSSTLWLRLFPLLSFRGEKTNSCWLEKSVNPQMERTICPCQLIPLMKCFYVQHVQQFCNNSLTLPCPLPLLQVSKCVLLESSSKFISFAAIKPKGSQLLCFFQRSLEYHARYLDSEKKVKSHLPILFQKTKIKWTQCWTYDPITQ